MAAEQIPLVHNALSLAEQNVKAENITEEALQSAKPILERCREIPLV
jgi:N-terminal domain on NACHT_NTPase and P-loop NTPases